MNRESGSGTLVPRTGTGTIAMPVLVALFVVLVGALSRCAGHQPRSHRVAIRNFLYDPATIVVATQDTIVWQNTDFIPHTATANDRAWDSGPLTMNGSWRFVVTKPGRYSYYCVFHPNMRATIEAR